MLNRRVFLRHMGLAGLCLTPLAAACQAVAKDDDGAKSKKKGNRMESHESPRTGEAARPALDAHVPAHLLTATFALG